MPPPSGQPSSSQAQTQISAALHLSEAEMAMVFKNFDFDMGNVNPINHFENSPVQLISIDTGMFSGVHQMQDSSAAQQDTMMGGTTTAGPPPVPPSIKRSYSMLGERKIRDSICPR